MTESIIVALITAGCTLAGVIISNGATSNKMQAEIAKNQAVMEERIDNLTEEVRRHNNFAQRMPVLEEQMKVANHRIEDLERRDLQ